VVKLKTSFQKFCGDRNHDLLKYTEYICRRWPQICSVSFTTKILVKIGHK